ncbi:MAG: hypothetical protein HYT80_01235, partial [Euryarchaeota archaeon]|nr:hypothetical protein [Euryarchaeota archaeon]
MSRKVAVVGAGMTPFGDRKETPRELFSMAVMEALGSVDRGLEAKRIQEAWIGSVAMGGYQLGNLGTLAVESAGIHEVPARRVENACASSGYALRDAFLAVRSGAVDVALVGGLEKMNDLTRVHQRYWLGVSGDTEWERTAGLTFPGTYALMARRHMHEFGTTEEQLAEVHDCFTIAEVMALEDLGFCKKGDGGPYAASGATARDGKTPI